MPRREVGTESLIQKTTNSSPFGHSRRKSGSCE